MALPRTALLLLFIVYIHSAAARTLKATAARQGSGRVETRRLSRKHFKQHGGAAAALGQLTLAKLKRRSGFRGSTDELAKHLDKEDELGVDTVNNELLYVCEGLSANASAAELASAVAPSAADPSATVAQAFSLSSRPGAARKIVLDFDGHTTANTSWNSLVGIASIATPAYDKDGSPDTWSTEELSDIIAIWRAVAEDYSAFDVDVTTVDPGNAALVGTGIRVAIGGSYTDWYGNAAGGVAYVGSFGRTDTPCFVFPQNLGPTFAKYVWEAVSHEVGHTLGLLHDGTASSPYYTGQGDWAPIMGSGYYKPLTTFDKGEYAGASNTQDDVAVINGYLPLVPQRNGNSIATATPLNATLSADGTTATATATGVVSGPSEVDYFSFTAAAGSVTLAVAVTAPWAGSNNRANLDVQLRVLDSASNVVATLNPAGTDAANGLGVPATSVRLPASGTYFVAVAGAGAGDPLATGYSAYGSRGAFELRVSFAPCTGNCSTPIVLPSSPSPALAAALESSPSPAPLTPLKVTSITMGKVYTSTAKTAYYCTATIYIKTSAGAVAVVGAGVSGSWTAVPSNAAFAAATAVIKTGTAGTSAFRSGSITAAAGNSCVFSVRTVELTGYVLDSTSVMSKSLGW